MTTLAGHLLDLVQEELAAQGGAHSDHGLASGTLLVPEEALGELASVLSRPKFIGEKGPGSDYYTAAAAGRLGPD